MRRRLLHGLAAVLLGAAAGGGPAAAGATPEPALLEAMDATELQALRAGAGLPAAVPATGPSIRLWDEVRRPVPPPPPPQQQGTITSNGRQR
jgi:hypothetical protein